MVGWEVWQHKARKAVSVGAEEDGVRLGRRVGRVQEKRCSNA